MFLPSKCFITLDRQFISNAMALKVKTRHIGQFNLVFLGAEPVIAREGKVDNRYQLKFSCDTHFSTGDGAITYNAQEASQLGATWKAKMSPESLKTYKKLLQVGSNIVVRAAIDVFNMGKDNDGIWFEILEVVSSDVSQNQYVATT